MRITGLNHHQLAKYREEAARVVARYDIDLDGRVSRHEAMREERLGGHSYAYATRISDDWVQRATVYEDRFATLRPEVVMSADRDGDGRMDVDELVEAYMTSKDTNGDGTLGFWERAFMSAGAMVELVERTFSVERDRRTTLVYDPLPDYSRPVPPRPDPVRPLPPRPDVDRPRPPRPDDDRPRPPRPDVDRPRPPRPDGDRPRPPRPDVDRPLPPRP